MKRELPVHARMDQFSIRENEIHVGGFSITELSKQFGSTPFYVYDKQVIAQRVSRLRQLLPSDVHVHYTIKTNPIQQLVNYMSELVDGFDVASAGELKKVLQTDIDRSNISFAGPGKDKSELELAISEGIVINAESHTELLTIAELCDQMAKPAHIALRVNPDFELKSSGVSMGGGAKQFGIDAEQIPQALQFMKARQMSLNGFHIFAGSQNLSHTAIIDAQENTFQLANRLAEAWAEPIESLNIGGGFGIPYFPGDRHLQLEPIAEYLHKKMSQIRFPKIILELGRYLVGEAGLYVSKVLDKKVSRGQTFLITDGGLHQHLAASGNFGQVIRKNYPVIIGNKAAQPLSETATIVGRLCMPLDIIADKLRVPCTEIGDLVVVYQSGAYGYSASPADFLNHPQIREYLI